ncbi:MAG TPA: hypothetical protein DEA55_02760 [Rhodospirillaceae bacterium]|nr:hypothetical protein [Rhodospirillaceae bacterium]
MAGFDWNKKITGQLIVHLLVQYGCRLNPLELFALPFASFNDCEKETVTVPPQSSLMIFAVFRSQGTII